MLTREILRRVREIQVRTGRQVADVLAGEYVSVFKGRGMEFEEVRPYVAGDDILSYWPNDVISTGCDQNDYVWRAEGGHVTDKNDLPIKQVFTGDTGDSGEQALITIGPLRVR